MSQEWVNYLEEGEGFEELKRELAEGPCKKQLVPWEHKGTMFFCAYCGNMGFKLCGKCREVRYCDRECQVAHWKAGHKARCGMPGAAKADTDAAIQCSGRKFWMIEPMQMMTESKK